MWGPVSIISAHLLGKQEVSRLMLGLLTLLWATFSITLHNGSYR